MKAQKLISLMLFIAMSGVTTANTFHVSMEGKDSNPGTLKEPFRTIAHAADLAQPGDTVLVHEGIYREEIRPVTGGTSDLMRIVYMAAPGEKAVIKGSEVITGWKKHKGKVWKVTLPNSFFGDYNPYSTLLEGDWLNKKGFNHHTGEVFLNGKSLFEKNSLEEVIASEPYQDARDVESSIYTWYSEVDAEQTTIWANFQDADPNRELVEINVRQSCFYPEKPGVDYITVRGFIMDQAATQWAAPTAEQIGLIGTHWSKGWVIEDNVISNSKCVGITLGKDRSTGQNVWMNNPQKDGATHYNEVIFRALEIGWSKEHIGSHIVRNNMIFRCGQAGIVGSLGAVFSKIYNNHIYDIWSRRIFTGAEMAGIKIHASIDMLIKNNRIHNTGRGIWIDWMAQGTRITGNLFYDNTTDDLFTEVNHGPYLVDNNIFLSDLSINDWSEGGAFVHNLVAGYINIWHVHGRFTPYHLPHSTSVAGVRNIYCGDNRFYNNIFLSKGGDENIEETRARFYGLHGYSIALFENQTGGNVYYHGAKPYEKEADYQSSPSWNPSPEIIEKEGKVYLSLELDVAVFEGNRQVVTTELLGTTVVSEGIYEQPDGTPYVLNTDYSGQDRNKENPVPGPFEQVKKGKNMILVWGD